MSKHIDTDIIQRFLEGDSSPAVMDMLAHIKTCPICREEFDLTLLTEESLLTEQSPKQISTATNPELSDIAWQTAINNAWEKATPIQSKSKETRLTHHRYLYAIAACLIFIFSGYFLFKPVPISEQKVSLAIQPPKIKPPVRTLPAKNFKINHNATVVASKESDVRITENTAKQTIAQMEQGTALFSIEPGQYKNFQVNTPDAIISVTGTIFDVNISENITRVSVLRGSVSVFYKKLRSKISLKKDETAFPDSNRIETRPLSTREKAEITLYLDNLTTQLIEEQQKTPMHVKESVPQIPLAQLLEQKLTLGFKSMDAQDFVTALSYFNEVKAGNLKNSASQTACFETGLLLLNKMNRTEEGIATLEEYLNKFETGLYQEEALTELISANRRLNRTEPVIHFTKAFAHAFPEKEQARDFLYEAATLERETQKSFPEAAQTYLQFIEKYPSDFRCEDAYFWLGKCHLLSQKVALAKEVFTKYLALYPDGRWVTDIKMQLR